MSSRYQLYYVPTNSKISYRAIEIGVFESLALVGLADEMGVVTANEGRLECLVSTDYNFLAIKLGDHIRYRDASMPDILFYFDEEAHQVAHSLDY